MADLKRLQFVDTVQIEAKAKIMALRRLHREKPKLSWDELCLSVNRKYRGKRVSFATTPERERTLAGASRSVSPPPAPTDLEPRERVDEEADDVFSPEPIDRMADDGESDGETDENSDENADENPDENPDENVDEKADETSETSMDNNDPYEQLAAARNNDFRWCLKIVGIGMVVYVGFLMGCGVLVQYFDS